MDFVAELDADRVVREPGHRVRERLQLLVIAVAVCKGERDPLLLADTDATVVRDVRAADDGDERCRQKGQTNGLGQCGAMGHLKVLRD